MIRTIVFEDEITVWWERTSMLPQDGSFAIVLNGALQGKTTKTYYKLRNVQAETEYSITVLLVDGAEHTLQELGRVTVNTPKKKKRLDITQAPYFAVGDGVVLNTDAIQRAFDDCKADEIVYCPKGVYMTGALNVHSDTEIYLAEGATLQGTQNVEDYLPKRKSRFEGIEMECYSSLLNLGELDRNGGYNCKNVIIRGGGTVSGGGKALAFAMIEKERERLKEFLEQNASYVKTCENANTIPGRARGRLINMSNCQNVAISNVTMQYGPGWNMHMIYSKDIVTFGCKIISNGVWNGDGWDPDSSENCAIFDTEFFTHDDAIAIKSGKNPEGNIINRPTRNIYVFDCRGRNGVAIGSEMSGGVENVYIWDCDFPSSYSGLHIKTTRKRGGFIRNIHIKNSTFVSFSVSSDLPYNNDGESAPTLPKIENISVENLEVTGVRIYPDGRTENLTCVKLHGLKENEYHLENVSLKNIRIRYRAECEEQIINVKNVKNLSLENLNFIQYQEENKTK